ncbi:hypothetical protein Glove_97g15 [Diversispora epigaea]|uniref:TRP C-terminal domain-containing protein n=1 Tax=Diversispora epigaea TaxID=1348612 RepID=A0A397J4S9_9GLOM|nr:hypothetical protein Glove_97g15 [Diversispora epigaea]
MVHRENSSEQYSLFSTWWNVSCAAPILLSSHPFCCLSTVVSPRLLDLSHDRDAFNAPVHTFIYGALYTQYRDHSEMKQTCLWFFVFTFAYDVIRAIATGGARQSGAVQTSLIVILLIPFLVNSINFLKSLILALQFIIIGSLFMVILLQLIDLIRGFIRKDKGNDDANVN